MPRDQDLSELFTLNDAEVETLRRAARERGLGFDKDRRHYTREELRQFGLVREAYRTDEIRAAGFGPSAVTSFDSAAERARSELRVDAPFGTEIEKWQLPVNMIELRVFETVFPPATVVAPHVHPENTADDPGGSLRIVTKGSLTYDGRRFGPGDWFFVPNGQSYRFTSDPDVTTHVMYLYRFFAATEGNRFSHPHGVTEDN